MIFCLDRQCLRNNISHILCPSAFQGLIRVCHKHRPRQGLEVCVTLPPHNLVDDLSGRNIYRNYQFEKMSHL